jgi:hypothetical protein
VSAKTAQSLELLASFIFSNLINSNLNPIKHLGSMLICPIHANNL